MHTCVSNTPEKEKKEAVCIAGVLVKTHTNNTPTQTHMDKHTRWHFSSSGGFWGVFCWGLSQLQRWQLIGEESETGIDSLTSVTWSARHQAWSQDWYEVLWELKIKSSCARQATRPYWIFFRLLMRHPKPCIFFSIGKVVSFIIYGIFDLMNVLRKR